MQLKIYAPTEWEGSCNPTNASPSAIAWVVCAGKWGCSRHRFLSTGSEEAGHHPAPSSVVYKCKLIFQWLDYSSTFFALQEILFLWPCLLLTLYHALFGGKYLSVFCSNCTWGENSPVLAAICLLSLSVYIWLLLLWRISGAEYIKPVRVKGRRKESKLLSLFNTGLVTPELSFWLHRFWPCRLLGHCFLSHHKLPPKSVGIWAQWTMHLHSLWAGDKGHIRKPDLCTWWIGINGCFSKQKSALCITFGPKSVSRAGELACTLSLIQNCGLVLFSFVHEKWLYPSCVQPLNRAVCQGASCL